MVAMVAMVGPPAVAAVWAVAGICRVALAAVDEPVMRQTEHPAVVPADK
jgi:hypothetical protein